MSDEEDDLPLAPPRPCTLAELLDLKAALGKHVAAEEPPPTPLARAPSPSDSAAAVGPCA